MLPHQFDARPQHLELVRIVEGPAVVDRHVAAEHGVYHLEAHAVHGVEERELAALVFNMAMEQGRRNPVVWVAAVLGVSERTASRRLTEAEAQGLTTRPQKQTREMTKKARTKRGKK